ncbi:MAG: PAS-domain containing protein, partial [Rhodospirillales bacterium]|nr:PAS-domain containing protein [Rhodospirillales bacterium]
MLLQDIENRAATETALRVSENKQRNAQEQLENLISNLPGGIYRRVLRTDGSQYIEYNLGQMPRALGVETEFGKKPANVISNFSTPAYRKIRDDAVRQSAEQMTPCIFEYPVLMPDESIMWIQSMSTPHRRKNGEIVWDGLNFDITQRKQAEKALYESEKNLRGAIDSIQEGFALFDADDRLIAINDFYRQINPFAQDILEKGLYFEDLIRANVGAGRLVEAVGREEEFIRERLELHRNPKGSIIREISDGKWCMIQEIRTPQGGTVLTFVDISDLKMAEKALRTSEQRLKDIAEAASDWFWEQDAAFRFIDIGEFDNNKFLRYARESIGQTRWGFAGINPEESEHWQNHVDDLMAHRSFRDFRYNALNDDGTEIVLSVSGKPVFSADGTFTGYRGSATNLSELAQAQNANERFLHALDHLDEGLALWDAEGRLVLSNKYLRKVAGPAGVHLRPGITFKKWLQAHVRHDSLPEAVGRDEAWVAERLAYFQNPVGAKEVQRKGRWYQFRLQRLPDGSIMHRTVDIHDIKVSEGALRQAEKIKAVGQLTGGIAHDFNNLLHIITGNLQMLDEDLRHDISAQKMISAATTAAFRGGELTQQLLAFSRQQELHPEVVAVNEVIIDTLKLIERTLGENIMIATAFGEGLGRVNIDPGMLGNAILNLAINARDAMPNGGKLRIATVGINQEAIGQDDAIVSGSYVQITVSDTGTGMDAETLNHVFEPFFTTKEVGKGSGMGLSMVYGFVTQSGGHVSIDSEEGKGT